MMTNPKIVLISVGSNLTSAIGSPRETVLKARLMVERIVAVDVKMSRLFRSAAFPAGSGPDFVNAGFAFDSDLDPAELLGLLHEIEAEADRERVTRWSPRTLDLDLIAVGEEVAPTKTAWQYWAELPLEQQKVDTPKELILPHPRLQDRPFVLVPLSDLAPDWRHPVLRRTIGEMCAALDPEQMKGLHAIE